MRKITYYCHYWKIISIYNFKKYDLRVVSFETGLKAQMNLAFCARREEYHKKRDKSFDFMQIGEDDFEENYDGFV